MAVAGVAAALIFPPVLEALGGSPLGVAVSLAYPCMDVVLLGLLSGAFAASKWRIGGTWLLIAAALLLFGVCDVVYLSVVGQSTFALNLASVGWPLAFLLLALASWLPATESGAAPAVADGRRIVVPIAMAAVGVTLLAVGSFTSIGAAAVALGVACLAAVLVRLVITFDQNRQMLVASQEEAVTDALTGLANRRALMVDLERGALGQPAGGDGARDLRPRRLQGLQRQLRPPGRRRPAAAARPPAGRDDAALRPRLPARRR